MSLERAAQSYGFSGADPSEPSGMMTAAAAARLLPRVDTDS